MKMYSSFFQVVICILLAGFSQASSQQMRIKIPIVLTDNAGDTERVYFGIDDRATFCEDTALGEFTVPFDACGLPGSCFLCSLFLDPRGISDACFEEGMFTDLRGYYGPAQKDTFKLDLPYCGTLYPVKIEWPDSLAQLFDSVRIADFFGGAIYYANMAVTDSLLIPSQFPDLYIVTTGPKMTVGVMGESGSHPLQFALFQNYPNPFNPSTKIHYALGRIEYLTLKIFDVFGREVANLAEGRKAPGAYDAEWYAAGVASGVYFCRLQTEEFVSVKKMILAR
jgi:hypothetical protein